MIVIGCVKQFLLVDKMKTTLAILLLSVFLFVNGCVYPQADSPAEPIENVSARPSPRLREKPNPIWKKDYSEFKCRHECIVNGQKIKRILEVKVSDTKMPLKSVKAIVNNKCRINNAKYCSCQAVYEGAAASTKQNVQWLLIWLKQACEATPTTVRIPVTPTKIKSKPVKSKTPFMFAFNRWAAAIRKSRYGRRTLSVSSNVETLAFRHLHRRFRQRRRNSFKLKARKGSKGSKRVWRKHPTKRTKRRHSRKFSGKRRFHNNSKAVKLPPKHRYNTLTLTELPQNVLVVETFGVEEFGL